MKEFRELIEINEETERLKEKIAKLQDPYLEKMKKIKEDMEADIAGDAALLEEFQEREKAIRAMLLEEWPEGVDKQYEDKDTGLIITRKVRTTPEVHDLKALMAQAVTFDKMPVKDVKWINKDLKALISAGVVKPEVATLKETPELAITFPKE